MLRFKTLTLCPIDTRLIEREMLSEAEVAWLNAYHRMVRSRLTPLVSPEAAGWLEEATRPL
jgi:Xaa-Pro aminopeptidase